MLNASRKNKCSVCNTIGHNKRRCPTNGNNQTVNNQNLQNNDNVNMNNPTFNNQNIQNNNVNMNNPIFSNCTFNNYYPLGLSVTVAGVLNDQPNEIDDNSTISFLNQKEVKWRVSKDAVKSWNSLTPEEKKNKSGKKYTENYEKRDIADILREKHHENLIEAGDRTIEILKDPTVYSNEMVIVAECGCGKSEFTSYTAYRLQTSVDLYDGYITPRIENTFLITGWSDSKYVDTMADTMFTIPKENIFHLNTIPRLQQAMIRKPTLLNGMTIFIDEARLVVQKNQTIWKLFKSLGMLTSNNEELDMEVLIKFDIQIFYIDATPDTHDLRANIPRIKVRNGYTYKGVTEFHDSMRDHSVYDINKQDGFTNLVDLFKEQVNKDKTHLLRLSNSQQSTALTDELKRLGYRVVNDFSNTSARNVDVIDQEINKEGTVIILKGKYRCSKRLRLRQNIGIVYEIPTKEPSDPTITQSLPARFFGYYTMQQLFQVETIFIVNTECFNRQLEYLATGKLPYGYKSGLVKTDIHADGEVFPSLKEGKSTYNHTSTSITQEEKLAIQQSSRAKEGILTSGSNNLCHHREIPDNELYEDQLNRIRNYVPEDATVENWAEYYPTAEKARDRLRSLGANVNTAGNNTQALNVNDNGRLSMFSNFDIGESAILQKFNDGRHIVYRINKTDDNRFQLRWIIKMQNWVMR